MEINLRFQQDRETISFWAAIVICIATVIAVFVYVITLDVPDKTIAVDKTIETAAGQMGIELRDKAYLRNKFTEGVGFGGAGGQGAAEIGEKSREKFLEQLKVNEKWPMLKTAYIVYAFEIARVNGQSQVARKYWPISASGFAMLDEFNEYYPIPEGYAYKDANDNEIVFEKDEGTYFIYAVIAAVATLAAYYYVIFSRLEALIEWLLYNSWKLVDKKRELAS